MPLSRQITTASSGVRWRRELCAYHRTDPASLSSGLRPRPPPRAQSHPNLAIIVTIPHARQGRDLCLVSPAPRISSTKGQVRSSNPVVFPNASISPRPSGMVPFAPSHWPQRGTDVHSEAGEHSVWHFPCPSLRVSECLSSLAAFLVTARTSAPRKKRGSQKHWRRCA